MSPAEQHDQHREPTGPTVAQPENEAQTPQIMRGGGGNVDKIRDILFGSQMRDYESRFARLEETLVKENAEIRETNRRRFEQLEAFVRKEFDSIQSRARAWATEKPIPLALPAPVTSATRPPRGNELMRALSLPG